MHKGILIVLGAFLAVLALGAALALWTSDSRVDADEAERQLETRLANGIDYKCSAEEDPDETVANGEIDVDYFCSPERPNERRGETGYWFGTDGEGISTELVPAG